MECDSTTTISRPFASFDFTRFGQFTARSEESAGTMFGAWAGEVAITRPPFYARKRAHRDWRERERQTRGFLFASISSPPLVLVPAWLGGSPRESCSRDSALRRRT